MGRQYFSAISKMAFKCFSSKTDPQGLDGLLIRMATVFASMIDSICSRSICHSFSGIKLYSLVLIPRPFAKVEYNGNPGLGTNMFCPALATAEMQRSKEQEQPEQRMTSWGVKLSPIWSATA